MNHLLETARKTIGQCREDRITFISSGVAFRVTLSIFPAIALLVFVVQHVTNASGLEFIEKFSGVLPDSTRAIMREAARSAVASNPGSSKAAQSIGTIGPFLAAAFLIWSANGGTRALFQAMNVVFDKEEDRGFFSFMATTLVFTFGLLLTLAFVITVTLVLPSLLTLFGVEGLVQTGMKFARWPLLVVFLAFGITTLYRFGPSNNSRPCLLTSGSLCASCLVALTSALFSWFVGTFAALNLTYGSLSTIVAFMIWTWLSFTIVLAGAEWDAVLKHGRTSNARPKAGVPESCDPRFR